MPSQDEEPAAGPALAATLSEVGAAIKPRLRGLLHGIAFPFAVVGGIVLVGLGETARARLADGIYAVTAALLFGISALYHRGSWSPRKALLLKRLDHSNIFLIIAGTYTPFALLALHGARSTAVLCVVWAGAAGGVLFRLLWTGAPRALYTPVYIALGWVAVFVLPDLLRRGGVAVLVLIVLGGILYSVGGVVYATRRPNPWPRVFGFHEVFHALTVSAFAAQYAAVSLVTYRL